jgi:general secretion pathway protein C
MSARWVTFLVWAIVAASGVAWALKLFVTAQGAPSQATVAGMSQLPRGDVTRVLGADLPPPVDPAAGETVETSGDARFQLVGVVAPRGNEVARGGVALIAVDGKPAKAFRIGAVVDGENVLQAVRARGVDLGPAGGKVVVALNIPPPAAAATGTLPSAGTPAAAPAAPAARPAGVPVPAATPTVAPVAPAVAPGATPAAPTPRRGGVTGPPAVPPQPGALPPAPPPAPVTPLPTAAPGQTQQPQIR